MHIRKSKLILLNKLLNLSYETDITRCCCRACSEPTIVHHLCTELSTDYDERPRQKADKKQGKEAITDYEVLGVNPDGTIDIEFRPITGRTHQLRVHSAHHLGLGRPILGEMLYGGHSKTAPETPERLNLHAFSITFSHPESGTEITLESLLNIF